MREARCYSGLQTIRHMRYGVIILIAIIEATLYDYAICLRGHIIISHCYVISDITLLVTTLRRYARWLLLLL